MKIQNGRSRGKVLVRQKRGTCAPISVSNTVCCRFCWLYLVQGQGGGGGAGAKALYNDMYGLVCLCFIFVSLPLSLF